MDTPRPLSPEHHGTRTHSELACCLSYLATVPLQRLDDSFWIKAHTQILAQIVRYVVGEHAAFDFKILSTILSSFVPPLADAFFKRITST